MKNVPKLRFKDINKQDFPAWERVEIGEFLEEISELSSDDTLPVYSLTIESGVTPKTDRYEREHLVGNVESAYKLVNDQCFVYNPMNLRFGAIARYSGKTSVRVSKYYDVFKFNELSNPIFFSFFLKTYNMLCFYEKMSTGSLLEKKRVHFLNFVNFKIPIPTLPEQTKIADFLTAIDDRISQLAQKCELLEQYKKAVMQQIFSQKLRFKDEEGQEFPAWDSVDLGSIAFKVNAKNKDGSISNVLTNSAVQGIVSQNEFFDKDIANKNNLEGYYLVEINDFVYNPRISSNAPVGPIKRNKLIKGVMSPLYTVFRFKTGCLDFLEYFFETTYWHDHMRSVSNMGARFDRMNITNEGFFSLPIMLPSVAEQEKIAGFLSAINEKFSQAQAKLNALKQYKQGLLQQMFV